MPHFLLINFFLLHYPPSDNAKYHSWRYSHISMIFTVVTITSASLTCTSSALLVFASFFVLYPAFMYIIYTLFLFGRKWIWISFGSMQKSSSSLGLSPNSHHHYPLPRACLRQHHTDHRRYRHSGSHKKKKKKKIGLTLNDSRYHHKNSCSKYKVVCDSENIIYKDFMR